MFREALHDKTPNQPPARTHKGLKVGCPSSVTGSIGPVVRVSNQSPPQPRVLIKLACEDPPAEKKQGKRSLFPPAPKKQGKYGHSTTDDEENHPPIATK